jgi:hypothetical protein
MQLLDRYLSAVRFWLPARHKDDIIAELSEDLRSAIADEEAPLGRALTNDEIAGLLKRRGHPIVVAGAYMPQRALIGPALFPVYVSVLKIIALCFIAPWIAVWAAVLFSVPSVSAAHPSLASKLVTVWGASWTGLIGAFGLVTLVFALIERLQTRSRLFQNWDPRKLPPSFDEIPRAASAFEVAALLTFGIWWVHFMSSREIVFGPSVRIVLTPLWAYFFWGVLSVTAINIVLSSVNLTRPYWTARRAVLRLASDAAGAAIFCAFLRIGIFESMSVASVAATRTVEVVRQVNLWSARVMPVAIVVGVGIVTWDVVRVWRLLHMSSTVHTDRLAGHEV